MNAQTPHILNTTSSYVPFLSYTHPVCNITNAFNNYFSVEVECNIIPIIPLVVMEDIKLSDYDMIAFIINEDIIDLFYSDYQIYKSHHPGVDIFNISNMIYVHFNSQSYINGDFSQFGFNISGFLTSRKNIV